MLKNYVVSSSEIDRLFFKDVFRKAAQFEILTLEETERWLQYREERNQTAHEYGQGFAESVLALVTDFIIDAKSIVDATHKFNKLNAN